MARSPDEREREIYRLRVEEGLTLREIGRRFGIGPERVRQLVCRCARQKAGDPVDVKAMSRTAAARRRASDLERAQAQAANLRAAWREGRKPEWIAKAFSLPCRSVAQVLRAELTVEDRAARAYARTLAKRSLVRTDEMPST